MEKRDTSRLGSIRLRGSERRDWSRDGCIVSCLRCSADWLHPGSVDCTLRFRRVSNRAISNPVLFLCRVSFFFLLPPPPCCSSVSTLEPPFFFIFPTPFSLLSLEHPAAIDRQKKPRGYLIIAHHDGTPLALFHGFTKVQHFSTLPAGESLKYLEVIPWTCATFANPRAFCLFLFPPPRSRSILPSPALPGVANKRYKSEFTISNAAAFIIAITTSWPSCAPLLLLCRSHLQTVTS